MCFHIKFTDILAGVIHRHKAFLVERNQIVDTIYFVQWEIGVNAVCPWRVGNKPSPTNAALELVTIEGVSPIHDKLEIVELSPLSIAGSPSHFDGIHFIKTRIDALLLRALKICLSPGLGIGRFVLVLVSRLFPSAKGESGKADVDAAVFNRWNFLLILLVDTGKILYFVGWNPFSFVLL